ncbi:MAG TPA: glucan biosynthesis protein, partial [Bacteroidia bacterium]|nr:glucan biosynthesis protein [Bacteroidia bacterium]
MIASRLRLMAGSLLLASSPLPAQDFSFGQLCEEARRIAAAPYAPPTDQLADYWKNLSYDGHRDIRFKMESGLWWNDGPFSID